VGHIRHHHLWYYVLFLQGASLFLLVAVAMSSQLLAELLGDAAFQRIISLAHGLALPLACVAAYFGIFFGFLSRRFERQADIFGCRAVSCGRPDCSPHDPASASPSRAALCPTGIRTFVGALEKISTLNGCTRDMRSWRHFSIARRVEFLERLAARPELEQRFQRVILLLKLLVVAALAVSGWWVWLQSRGLGALLFGPAGEGFAG
jgi:STE24 endopeptidase